MNNLDQKIRDDVRKELRKKSFNINSFKVITLIFLIIFAIPSLLLISQKTGVTGLVTAKINSLESCNLDLVFFKESTIQCRLLEYDKRKVSLLLMNKDTILYNIESVSIEHCSKDVNAELKGDEFLTIDIDCRNLKTINELSLTYTDKITGLSKTKKGTVTLLD